MDIILNIVGDANDRLVENGEDLLLIRRFVKFCENNMMI